MIVSFTFIQNDCFLCQSIQKEKKLSKDENTEDITCILPTPSSPPPKKKTSNVLKLQSFGNTNICILHLHCFTLI